MPREPVRRDVDAIDIPSKGDKPRYRQSSVLNHLRAYGELTVKELEALEDVDANNIGKALWVLRKAGRVERTNGRKIPAG